MFVGIKVWFRIFSFLYIKKQQYSVLMVHGFDYAYYLCFCVYHLCGIWYSQDNCCQDTSSVTSLSLGILRENWANDGFYKLTRHWFLREIGKRPLQPLKKTLQKIAPTLLLPAVFAGYRCKFIRLQPVSKVGTLISQLCSKISRAKSSHFNKNTHNQECFAWGQKNPSTVFATDSIWSCEFVALINRHLYTLFCQRYWDTPPPVV